MAAIRRRNTFSNTTCNPSSMRSALGSAWLTIQATVQNGSSEQLVGEIWMLFWQLKVAPLGNLNNKACVFMLGVDELVRLRSSFHPSGPFAAPGGEPRRMKGRRSLLDSSSQGRIASCGGSGLDEFGSLSTRNGCQQDATENYLQSRDGIQTAHELQGDCAILGNVA